MTSSDERVIATFTALCGLAVNAREDAQAGCLSPAWMVELADTLEELARQLREAVGQIEPGPPRRFSSSGPL